MLVKEKNYTAYFEKARAAARQSLRPELIKKVLNAVAAAAIDNTDYLLAENQRDLDRMDHRDPKYDRLKLTADRIKDIAVEIKNVAKLKNPLWRVLSRKTMVNGLNISKITVPLGVVAVIYEARPNVTFDVFSLCFKAGNAAVLKGGSDAEYSNKAILSVIQKVLNEYEIDPGFVT